MKLFGLARSPSTQDSESEDTSTSRRRRVKEDTTRTTENEPVGDRIASDIRSTPSSSEASQLEARSGASGSSVLATTDDTSHAELPSREAERRAPVSQNVEDSSSSSTEVERRAPVSEDCKSDDSSSREVERKANVMSEDASPPGEVTIYDHDKVDVSSSTDAERRSENGMIEDESTLREAVQSEDGKTEGDSPSSEAGKSENDIPEDTSSFREAERGMNDILGDVSTPSEAKRLEDQTHNESAERLPVNEDDKSDDAFTPREAEGGVDDMMEETLRSNDAESLEDETEDELAERSAPVNKDDKSEDASTPRESESGVNDILEDASTSSEAERLDDDKPALTPISSPSEAKGSVDDNLDDELTPNEAESSEDDKAEDESSPSEAARSAPVDNDESSEDVMPSREAEERVDDLLSDATFASEDGRLEDDKTEDTSSPLEAKRDEGDEADDESCSIKPGRSADDTTENASSAREAEGSEGDTLKKDTAPSGAERDEDGKPEDPPSPREAERSDHGKPDDESSPREAESEDNKIDDESSPTEEGRNGDDKTDDESPSPREADSSEGENSEEPSSPSEEETRWRFPGFQIKRRHLVALLILVISWEGRHHVEEFNMDDFLNQPLFQNLNDTMYPVAHYLDYLDQDKKRPGYLLAKEGAKAKYPIVIIPGFVTSGLEVWQSNDCGKKFFRQRLWTAMTAARSFILDKECWRQQMMLDPVSGGDPEGISLRAAQGFEAADYFVGNYWVWGKLIVCLGDIGYNPSIMSMESYDWRLSFPMLEKRDGYLTNLKSKIEALHKTTGLKVVLSTHSMGAMLVHYFFAWVTTPEREGGGGGGKDWVEKHVHTLINIAGSHLGVPKAASALLSGEMSDTVLTGMMAIVAENFFSRRLRRDLFSTWGSLWAMLPKGGNELWGVGADMCTKRSKDDPFCPDDLQTSPMFRITQQNTSDAEDRQIHNISGHAVKSEIDELALKFAKKETHSVDEINTFLLRYGAGRGSKTAAYRDFASNIEGRSSAESWHDVTITPLPHAPSMKMYCLYGVGNPTERAYHYQEWKSDTNDQELDTPHPSAVLDANYKDEGLNTTYGTRLVDGDGSVPLISLGYMCTDAWRRPETKLNPSSIKLVTREYSHATEFRVDDPMRGGPESSNHVDILGNDYMTFDFLRIVSDFENEVVEKDQIVSDIENIAQAINSSPFGGIRRQKPKTWNSWDEFVKLF